MSESPPTAALPLVPRFLPAVLSGARAAQRRAGVGLATCVHSRHGRAFKSAALSRYPRRQASALLAIAGGDEAWKSAATHVADITLESSGVEQARSEPFSRLALRGAHS